MIISSFIHTENLTSWQVLNSLFLNFSDCIDRLVLKGSSENGKLCLVVDFNGNIFHVFALSMAPAFSMGNTDMYFVCFMELYQYGLPCALHM